jgi:ABC-2 type transport system ATP-binding protein
MIARALMHEPTVLFLDEPTTGLDPQARLFVWDQVRAMRDRGVTVVITTHDMDEAAALADRVGIIDHGRLLALDTPDALTALVPGESMLEINVMHGDDRTFDAAGLESSLAALPGVERVEQVKARGPAMAGAPPGGNGHEGGARMRVYCTVEAASLIPPVVGLLAERDDNLDDLSLGRPSLEDVFIHLTGRDLRG